MPLDAHKNIFSSTCYHIKIIHTWILEFTHTFISYHYQQASSRCSSGKGYIVSIIIIIIIFIFIHRNIILTYFCLFSLFSFPPSYFCLLQFLQCDSEGDDDKVSNKILSLLIFIVRQSEPKETTCMWRRKKSVNEGRTIRTFISFYPFLLESLLLLLFSFIFIVYYIHKLEFPQNKNEFMLKKSSRFKKSRLLS